MGALHSMYYAKVWWGGNTAMHIMQYKKYKMQHKFKKSPKKQHKNKNAQVWWGENTAMHILQYKKFLSSLQAPTYSLHQMFQY